MQPSRLLFLFTVFGATLGSQGALAAIDPGATVVALRTSCQEVAGVTLNNCFTTTGDLQNWLDTQRTGTGTDPLSIEIGPGTFAPFACNRKSNLSLKGSGPDVTFLAGTPGLVAGEAGITADNCFNFNVQSLAVSSSSVAVLWTGGGSSRWTNVNLEGKNTAAWFDDGCDVVTDSNKAVHYWFNSRLRGVGWGYAAFCSESWFFGSEIMATGLGPYRGRIALLVSAVNSVGDANTTKPEVHVYGSVIRVKANPRRSFGKPAASVSDTGLIAVMAGKNADVHVHGTGIDVIGNELPNDVAALSAWDGGSIHANEAAYNLKTGTGGTVTRILMDTNDPNPATAVHAPYLWGQYPTRQHPSLPDISSVTGADTAVFTGTLDGHPHFVIYDKTCTTTSAPNSIWYDTTDKRCLP